MSPTIAVLLGTFQGEAFLAEQLDSIKAQSFSNWVVFAQDDHSQDSTFSILENYAKQWHDKFFCHRNNKRKGFLNNFLSLLCNQKIVADLYAFSDQDDIWEKNKLQRAADWLQDVPNDIPLLYCSRTFMADQHNNLIGYSKLFRKPAGFANALVQTMGGGNTMVFNHATKRILEEVGDEIDIVSHDWWVYILVTGCGGQVFYDFHPSLRYRQHKNNVLGTNNNWTGRLRRIRMLWHGKLKDWNEKHIRTLQALRHRLTPENRVILDRFSEARKAPMISRLIGIKKSGVYRQTFIDNVALLAAAFLNKL